MSDSVRLIGAKPRPRALVCGWDQAEAEARLADLFPTVRAVASLHDVRQAEWDALVCVGVMPDGGWYHLDDHLSVVCLGLDHLPKSNSMTTMHTNLDLKT